MAAQHTDCPTASRACRSESDLPSHHPRRTQTATEYTAGELRARLDPIARAHDVSLDELVNETRRILALPADERERLEAALREHGDLP